ncbi:kinase-like domain-containing protein, partial [Cerioporus squamosus]
QLPQDLHSWRIPGDETVLEEDAYWESLRSVFDQQGYTLWKKRSGIRVFDIPNIHDVIQNGWAYASPARTMNEVAGGAASLCMFQPLTSLCHAASARNGQCVVIRIVKMGDEGQQHLDILRRIGRAPHTLMSTNHAIPLLQEICFDDMTFCVFPFVGFPVDDAYQGWAENSVGDIVDMIVQMLEALAYIHKFRIAHLDAYKENFLVQYHPESLRSGKVAVSRPRVVLNDFESAVQFPAHTPVAEQVVTGTPRGVWESYGRKCPPEVYTGKPYNPYGVDIWQLGYSLSTLRTTVPQIDTVLTSLRDAERSSAKTHLDQLRDIVNATPPNALQISPVILNMG